MNEMVSPSIAAGDPPGQPAASTLTPASLREANRVLEEEIKVAGRPQTYLLLDLAAGVVFIKGRGIELQRFAIEGWEADDQSKLTGVYRLRQRPPIIRPKTVPGEAAEQEPISIADMPVTYALQYDPPLLVKVSPSAWSSPWSWGVSLLHDWWISLRAWMSGLATGTTKAARPSVRLTLASDQAQALAWTVTDGMPLLIRRSTDE
jgi:hypothetical protein